MNAVRISVVLACSLLLPFSTTLAYDGETEVILDGDQAFVVPRGGTIDDALIFPPRDDLAGGPRGAATRTIEVAVVYDVQFAALYGGDAPAQSRVCEVMAQARADMAALDSVDVDLAHIHLQALPATVPEPFLSTTDPTTLLVNFRDWAVANLPPYDTALLLTGRDLDGSTIGFAFTGATCTANGAAIAEGRKSAAFDGALVAHELGHSFGLCHDPPASRSMSVCSDLSAIGDPTGTCPGYIMEAASNPAIPRSEYSQCSGEDLDNFTTSLGGGSCLNNAPAGALDEACLAVPPVSTLCTAVPREDCAAAGKSVLQYKLNSDPSKNKMKWLWAKGGPVDVGDFGAPDTVDGYLEICQYDGLDGGTTYEGLATVLPPETGWKATGTTGFAYKDKDALVDGVKVVKLKAGVDGKSKVLVKAKGAGIQFPTGDATMVVQDPAVHAQLVSFTRCWDSTFAPEDVKKDEADQFKAIVK